MRVRQWVLILAMIPCLFLISACGGSAGNGETGNSEYRKMNLVMSVNGTDTQIDTRVARCFAQLVEERSGGNITVDVFPNDQLAGGISALIYSLAAKESSEQQKTVKVPDWGEV